MTRIEALAKHLWVAGAISTDEAVGLEAAVLCESADEVLEKYGTFGLQGVIEWQKEWLPTEDWTKVISSLPI